MQEELTQLQVEFMQLDARIDARLKDCQEGIKFEVHSEVRFELRSELRSLFEQYFGQNPPITVTSLMSEQQQELKRSVPKRRNNNNNRNMKMTVRKGKGKGILGSPPGFPTNEHLVVSPMPDLGHSGVSSRGGTLGAVNTSFRVDCPYFDGGNFRRGLHQLTWEVYAKGLKECFGSNSLIDPMAELVTLKQRGYIDQFHDEFLSLLNQLNLPETYALSIFISNLKPEIGQYLQLFKPQTLVDGYNLARQVENIVLGPVRKGLIAGSRVSSSRPLFPMFKVQQGMGSSASAGGMTSSNSRQSTPSKSLPQVELEDRRKKGLCFWCGSKYSLGHKCSKSLLYQLIIEPLWEQGSDMKSSTSEDSQDYSEQLDLTDQVPEIPTPVLSLHAL
ncbi:hypothetical protein CXB51_017837 [Gossypium anomalum]|uniref:Ty3 transposon capsid-like protein domain-containing protein n=1 Tax=Gossypium anomalum TaxID=47600 RepID=A0A8J5YXQ9_9ROSI|nr:hypothetical protein CXB51_017837 [Gossypium anomalum]